jgi:hypothetical protein
MEREPNPKPSQDQQVPPAEAAPRAAKSVSFASLVIPPMEDVAPELARIAARQAEQQRETARELEALLSGMEGRTFGSAAEAVAFARGLRRLLTSLERRVACTARTEHPDEPTCGLPAYVECTPTKAAPYWTLRFRHSPMDKGENAHGYFHTLPSLKLIQAPPDRRRKS